MFESQKTNLKIKIVLILVALGLFFVVFDKWKIYETMTKSGQIYQKGRRGKKKHNW